MDELALLKPKLARLKLSGMLDTLSERLSQALAEKWSYTQFLDTLLTDEAERRDFKQLGRRLTTRCAALRGGLAPDKVLFLTLFRVQFPRLSLSVEPRVSSIGPPV